MKTFLATLLVLLLSIPTAMAGSVDGKGIWCDRGNNSFGYWFHDNQFNSYTIEGYQVIQGRWSYDYKEIGTDLVRLGKRALDRTTLKIGSHQCHLVTSRQQLKGILQAIIDAAKTENKL